MRKQKIYLDTSVISHLDAPDAPEKMANTRELWKLLEAGVYDVVLSSVVFAELKRCSEPKRDYLTECLNKIRYEIVTADDNISLLARVFTDYGIMQAKSFDDCRHIAAALVSGCDIITSWNFKHIVNARTIRGARIISAAEGFKDIIICSPSMLIGGDFDDG